MAEKRNTPAGTRRVIEIFMLESGFEKMVLTPTPQVVGLPHDYAVYAHGSKRFTFKCYAKYGIVQLYIRGGIRIASDAPILKICRSVLEPLESADLEYRVGSSRGPGEEVTGSAVPGTPFWLPKNREESKTIVVDALRLLLDTIGPESEMVDVLLHNPTEYGRRSGVVGVRTHALQFVCADLYLSAKERIVTMRQAAQSAREAKVPPATPYSPFVGFMEDRLRELGQPPN